MRRAGLGVLGMFILLELLSAGGLQGGQNQARAGEPSVAELLGAPGLEWPSTHPPDLDTVPFPHLTSGTGGDPGVGVGIRNQPLDWKRKTNRRSSLLIGLYVSQGVLQALDAQATVRALHSGTAQEGNPLIRPFASQPAALVAVKLALGASIIYGVDLLHKSHPRLAKSALGSINAGYVYVVQRSYRSFPAR